MALNPELKDLLQKNLDTALGVYQDVKGTKDSLTEFLQRWEVEGDPYNFMQGFMIGDLQGSAVNTARTILGRALTKDERSDIISMIDEAKFKVKDLITRLKNV